ncbi:hypothetical protein [Halapricum desulfuricans]|uniref:Uncharacterized protein n=1 Tax=Halapricum desulfuricans TaxID=2841257 RepID=A0A897N7H6_9EURY|nr:hypothetical protein [Halapricum desulfuricans]QSG08667.1 hypothetical protein HSR122_1269 [Halapricum desulfuricans]QSG08829.1 hypothetical protein HSR122_1433 [Halapricum desulfuricans]
MSGDTVASAAVRRRQRLLITETHRSSYFETVQAQTKQIQRLLNGIMRLSM